MSGAGKLFKMRELSDLTRVSGATIRYYIREGILPQPIRTHRNMAYYDESYVRRIRLIKELQERRFLPLSMIKKVIEEREDPLGAKEIDTILAVEEELFKSETADPLTAPRTPEELGERTGLDVERLKDLQKAGFISSPKDGVYDEEDIQIAELMAQFREAGFTEENGFDLEMLEIYRELVEVLAEVEVDGFTSRVTRVGIPPDQATKMAEDGIRFVNGLMGLLHKRFILRILRDYSARAGARSSQDDQGPPADNGSKPHLSGVA